MNRKLLYILFLMPLMQGCVANSQTGDMQTGWLFWVFLGILLGLLFLGALTNYLKKRKSEDAPTKAEQEIEAYEETLEKKLRETTEDSERDDSEEPEKQKSDESEEGNSEES